jgi:hypothetical protein
MSRPSLRLFVALIGLTFFAASFMVIRLADEPPSGPWAFGLEAVGWLGIFVAARLISGGWLASSLVMAAWLLLFVSNGIGVGLIRRGTDRGLELGFNYVKALITLEAGTWLLTATLMFRGAARLWREETERERARS